MKFSGKMCFKIILKVTKKQGSTLSIEDTLFKKPQELVYFFLQFLKEEEKGFHLVERYFP